MLLIKNKNNVNKNNNNNYCISPCNTNYLGLISSCLTKNPFSLKMNESHYKKNIVDFLLVVKSWVFQSFTWSKALKAQINRLEWAACYYICIMKLSKKWQQKWLLKTTKRWTAFSNHLVISAVRGKAKTALWHVPCPWALWFIKLISPNAESCLFFLQLAISPAVLVYLDKCMKSISMKSSKQLLLVTGFLYILLG